LELRESRTHGGKLIGFYLSGVIAIWIIFIGPLSVGTFNSSRSLWRIG